MKIFTRDASFGIRLVTVLAALQISLLLASSAEAQTYEWTLLSPSVLPPARGKAAMTYDSGTNSMVLFGGSIDLSSTMLGDTWIFTRAAGWLQAFPPTSPPPRGAAAFAYDPVSKRAVLFGGEGLSDTWTWAGPSNFPQCHHPDAGLITIKWCLTHPLRRSCSLRATALMGHTLAIPGSGMEKQVFGPNASPRQAHPREAQLWRMTAPPNRSCFLAARMAQKPSSAIRGRGTESPGPNSFHRLHPKRA